MGKISYIIRRLPHGFSLFLTQSHTLSLSQSTNRDLALLCMQIADFSTMLIVIWISLFKRWVAPEVHFSMIVVCILAPFISNTHTPISIRNFGVLCGAHFIVLLIAQLIQSLLSLSRLLFMDFPSVPFLIYIYIVSKTHSAHTQCRHPNLSTQSIYQRHNWNLTLFSLSWIGVNFVMNTHTCTLLHHTHEHFSYTFTLK